MRETSIGTSLLLIAAGAILAFGVTVQSSAIDLNAIGAILLIVGLIGLIVSFIFINDWSWIDDRRATGGTITSSRSRARRLMSTGRLSAETSYTRTKLSLNGCGVYDASADRTTTG